MAPRIGDRRKDGKVYSGENYGYQSPAQHNKLQQAGKLKIGAQALDRAANAIPQPVRNIAAEAQRRLANPIIPSKAQALGFTGPSATDKALKAVSDKTNVDQRIVNTGAAVAQTAIAGRLTKPSPSQLSPRSVGAAAVNDVAGRTAPATRRLPNSARPSGTVRAGSAAPTRELTEARRSVVRPNTAQVARQASGPAHATSDPKQLAPGNSPARQAPSSSALKRQLKKKATTEYTKQVTEGYTGRVKRHTPGEDTTFYNPNHGRVSPTDKGRLADLKRTFDKRREDALKGLRGQARRNADNAFSRAETKRRKNIKYDAQEEASQYQKSQESKLRKGTTSAQRETMSADMARRPRTQGPRRPPTTTTGTKRVPANAKYGSSTTKTPDGDVKRPLRQSPRTLSEETGRPNLVGGTSGTRRSTTKPSPNRTRGANPAESRPKASSPAPKGSVQEQNAQRASQIKKAGADEGRKLGIKEEGDYTGQGLGVRSFKPGKTGGVKPNNGKGTDVAHYRGKATKDTVQWKGDRKQPIDPKTGIRVGAKRVGRLGQTNAQPTREPIPYSPYKKGQVSKPVNTPEQLKAQAARKAEAARKAKAAKPAAPKRPATRSAQLKAQSKARSASIRSTKGMTADQVRELKTKYNQELPKSPTTHFSGEVRLQGSKFSMDPQAKNLVDGSVSRTIGLAKNTGRSAEAAAAAKKTMKSVRGQRAKATAAVKARKPTVAKVNGRKKVIGTGLTRSVKPPKSSLTIPRKRG